MTAPDDPFRSPPPGSTPGGREAAGGPEPYRDPAGSPAYGSPGYGSQAPGSPPYGSPGYGSQAPGSPAYGGPAFGVARPSPRNGLGIAALVLGVLALLTGIFFIGGLLGIAAIVLGVLGRNRAKRGEATNGWMAVTGIVLGVLAVLLTAFAVYGAVTLFNSEEFSNLADCLQSAGNDTEAQQQCTDEFSEGVGG